MISKELDITSKTGLHARPATLLVNFAKGIQGAKVTITNEGKSASVNSMLGILSLGVNQGARITVSADGPEEEKVLNQICDYIINELSKLE